MPNTLSDASVAFASQIIDTLRKERPDVISMLFDASEVRRLNEGLKRQVELSRRRYVANGGK